MIISYLLGIESIFKNNQTMYSLSISLLQLSLVSFSRYKEYNIMLINCIDSGAPRLVSADIKFIACSYSSIVASIL